MALHKMKGLSLMSVLYAQSVTGLSVLEGCAALCQRSPWSQLLLHFTILGEGIPLPRLQYEEMVLAPLRTQYLLRVPPASVQALYHSSTDGSSLGAGERSYMDVVPGSPSRQTKISMELSEKRLQHNILALTDFQV
jgi:hypothetical protein